MASVNVGGRWHLWAWWILLLSMWAVFLFWAISFWWMNYALDDGKEFAKMYDPTMTKFKTDWFYGQEADLIFFALPTLFIAILGALYLSLPKTPNTARWPLGKFWSLLTTTPIVLPRPLGIIKVGELLSYLVFLALIAWGLWQWIVWGRNDVEKQYKAGEITTYKQKWQMELDHHSVTIAWVSFFPFYFLFYPITRRSILLQLMGVQYEQAVKYHRWLGYATILLGSVHSLLFWLLWIIQGKFEKVWRKKYLCPYSASNQPQQTHHSKATEKRWSCQRIRHFPTAVVPKGDSSLDGFVLCEISGTKLKLNMSDLLARAEMFLEEGKEQHGFWLGRAEEKKRVNKLEVWKT